MSYWEKQEKDLLEKLPKLTTLGIPKEIIAGSLGMMEILKDPAMRELSTAIEDRLIEIGFPATIHDTVLRILTETAKIDLAPKLPLIRNLEDALYMVNLWVCRRIGVEDGRLREISKKVSETLMFM